MPRSNFVLIALVSGVALSAGLFSGCSGASGGNNNGTGGGSAASGSGATGNGGKLNIGGSGQGGGGTGGGGTPITCNPGTPAPDFADVPGNGKDDDCDGTPDNAPTNCDGPLSIEDNDPMNGARAIGLCQVSDGNSWGVIEARYVRADGSPLATTIGHGLLDNFGPAVNVQEGGRMLVISSGTARRPGDLGFASPNDAMHLDLSTGVPEFSPMPPGFPYDPPACPGASACDPNNPLGDCNANDPAALELKIKAPANAKSFKFKFNFYTYEFPIYICSPFNDFFVVLQTPAPSNAVQGNISFDSQNNPVSVNNGFLEVCQAQNAGGKDFPCQLGTQQLSGTGFDETAEDGPHAATGWLETQSPVEPGSVFTLRFAVWDVGDHILDSTVLIDAFEFSLDESTGSITSPVPTPK